MLKRITSVFFLPILLAGPSLSQANCPVDSSAQTKISFPLKPQEMKNQFPQLRSSLPTLSGISDQQLMAIMASMGDNFYWAHPKFKDSTEGLLILAHGTNGPGDNELFEKTKPLSDNYITSIAFGMSMMTSNHISCALLQMRKQGVEKIYVVPLTESPYNTLFQQWKYAFGLGKKFAYGDIEKIKTEDIQFLEPINDHFYAREIVYDFAKEISINPKKELVIVVAHGPIDLEDNKKQLQLMSNIANHVKTQGGFYDAIPMSLQDDAAPKIREENIRQFRKIVEKNSRKGIRVLIVSDLTSSQGIQTRIKRDLSGLDYSFNEAGLSSHPLFLKWIETSIANAK